MKHRLAAPFAVVVALVLWMAPSAQAGTQSSITCGAQIMQSIVLTSNLTCAGTALSIGSMSSSSAPITVNLGGHTVTSTAAVGGGLCPEGMTIRMDMFGRVTLENGRIRGNGVGVCDLSFVNIYQNLVFDGADLFGGNDNYSTVRDNRFVHGAGVIFGENTVTVEDNLFIAGPADKTAVLGGYVAGVFSGNKVTGYGVGFDLADTFGLPRTVANNTVLGAGIGIRVESETGFGAISGNLVAGNSGDGILVSMPLGGGAFAGTMSGNIAVGNGGTALRSNCPPHRRPPSLTTWP